MTHNNYQQRFYQALDIADIEWRSSQGQNHQLSAPKAIPFSRQFNDIYFNPEYGLEESEYVFLTHNRFMYFIKCCRLKNQD